MQSTESLITVCFNSSLLKYGGDIAVGAMTVLSSIMQFAMMPLQGLTQGAQPIVSYNYGARKAQRVREAFKCLLKACVVYSMCLWILVQLFPRMFILIFNNSPELVDYASWARSVPATFSLQAMALPPWSLRHRMDGIQFPLAVPFKVGETSSP